MADTESVQQALTAHLVDCYRPLVDGGYLTDAGLMWLRGVLAAPGEWLPDAPGIRRLRYATDVALAERLHLDVSLLPGWEPPDWQAMGLDLPPDSPGDTGPPRW